MTEQETRKAKQAVTDSVKGLKDWIFINFSFSEESKKRIEEYASAEIRYGHDDIDRLDESYSYDGAREFYTEWNPHHPM